MFPTLDKLKIQNIIRFGAVNEELFWLINVFLSKNEELACMEHVVWEGADSDHST